MARYTYDSDYGVVVSPYRLTFPPAFSSSNVNNDVFATTPFTTVIWGAVEEDILNSGVQNCEELADNQKLQSDIIRRVSKKEWEVANRYNIPTSELYADFIADGNTHQHELAQLLTTGLAKGYTETAALMEANPGAWRATVEYYVERDEISGDWTKWFREERVFNGEESSLRVYAVSEDLETIGRLIVYRERVKATEGDVQKFTDQLIDYLPELDKYGCGITNDYTENKEVFGNDIITFSVTASMLVDDHNVCTDPLAYSATTPYANVYREKYADGGVILQQAGLWGFDYGDDAVVDQLISDGMYSSITDANQFVPFRNWDFALDSTEAYGARNWTRTSIITQADGTSVITDVNDKGIWIVRTTFPNGTHKTQCGDSLDTLVDVTDMGMCEELPIVPAS